MLSRLIYYSKSTRTMTMEDIRTILQKAKSNNIPRGITGALYFNEGYFVQILEGGRIEVNKIFNKIYADERHKDIIITDISSISHRNFENWTMLYLGKDNVGETELLKYSPTKELDLDRMSAENILEFVLNQKDKGREE